MFKNRRKYLILFIFVFTIVDVGSGAGSELKAPFLEDLIIQRMFDLYLEEGPVGGFTDGSTKFMNWQDTIDVLEILNSLNSLERLDVTKRQKIEQYILNERISEKIPSTDNVFLSEEVLDDKNTTLITERVEERVEWRDRSINWWGGVKKSIEALRMLQLMQIENETILNEVQSRILNYYGGNGVDWNINGDNWESTYWGLYKSSEWDLFNLLPQMGLLPLSPSTLDYMNGHHIEIEDEILFETSQDISWCSPTSFEVNLTTENVNEPLKSLLSLPMMHNLFGLEFSGHKYVPLVTVELGWNDIWNEDTLTLPNFENRSFAIENDILTNRSVDRQVNVTREDGSIQVMTLSTQEEYWKVSDLDYFIEVRIVSEDGECIFETSQRLNEPSALSLEIPLTYLRSTTNYEIEIKALQRIHQYHTLEPEEECEESISFNTSDLDINDTSNENPPQILGSWITVDFPIRAPLILKTSVPLMGYTSVTKLSEEGTYFAQLDCENTYPFYVWPNNGKDWDGLLQSNDLIPLVISNGGGSTSITEKGKFNILFILSEPQNDLCLPDRIIYKSHIIHPNEINYNSVKEYIPLFNQTSSELETIAQHLNFLDFLTLGTDVFDFLNEKSVLSSIFFHYNVSSRLFEENVRSSMNIWEIFDKLGLSETYLNAASYNQTLEKMIDENYLEVHDEKTGLVSGIRLVNVKDISQEELQSDPSEIEKTLEFVKLITYRNSWIFQISESQNPQFCFPHVGIAVRINSDNTQSEQIYKRAQAQAATEIYDLESLEVIDELLSEVTDKEQEITVFNSYNLPREFIYWKKELPVNSFLDLIFIDSISFGFLLGMGLSIIDFSKRKELAFSHFTLLGIMVFQAMSTPLIMNGLVSKLSRYIRATQVFVEMIEEGIYDLSESVSSRIGVLFINPLKYENILSDCFAGDTEQLRMASKQKGNSTKDFYREYRAGIQQKNLQRLENYYSTDHVTIQQVYLDQPSDYENFLIELAYLHRL